MMEALCKAISELTFASFCSYISQQGENEIEFKLKHSFHGNRIEEVFGIMEIDGKLLLSDKGSTLANLDNIYELSEPDVIKNIMAVLKTYNMYPNNNAFVFNIDPSQDVCPQIFHFLQGIHFLYAMKLFYT